MGLHVAVIGCGRVVQEAYAPAFALMNEIDAIHLIDTDSRSTYRVASILAEHDTNIDVSSSTTLDSAVSAADLAIVALPPDLAVDVVHDVIDLGTNVLAEKPYSLDSRVLQETQGRANACGVWAGVITNYLYRPDIVMAIETVMAGAVGSVRWTRIQMPTNRHWTGSPTYEPNWRGNALRLRGGVAADKGFHLLYLAEALSGSRIFSCEALAAKDARTGQVDFWSAQAAMLNGSTSALLTSWVGHGDIPNQIEVHGTVASLYVDPSMTRCIQLVDQGGHTAEIVFDARDAWGYAGQFRAAAEATMSKARTDLTGPMRWARFLGIS